MTLFVRLVAADRGIIIKTALSPEVLKALKPKGIETVDRGAVEVLLDSLLQQDDLWHEEALSPHPRDVSF